MQAHFYFNMCAIHKGNAKVNVNITTMCGPCKTDYQEKEEISTPKTGEYSKRYK